MSPDDYDQVHHIARLALLAMCARGVAASEFDTSEEVQKICITVSRGSDSELPVELEFFGSHVVPVGGMSL